MKIAARNVLKGKIKRVVHGLVTSEITIEVNGGLEIVSSINKSVGEQLGLAPGREVYGIIQATDVMIALD